MAHYCAALGISNEEIPSPWNYLHMGGNRQHSPPYHSRLKLMWTMTARLSTTNIKWGSWSCIPVDLLCNTQHLITSIRYHQMPLLPCYVALKLRLIWRCSTEILYWTTQHTCSYLSGFVELFLQPRYRHGFYTAILAGIWTADAGVWMNLTSNCVGW